MYLELFCNVEVQELACMCLMPLIFILLDITVKDSFFFLKAVRTGFCFFSKLT